MLRSIAGRTLPKERALADRVLETITLRKVSWRIVPFLALLYFAAFIDRVSISFAALQMNRDLGLTAQMYGLGAGLFFIGYCLFEVPSNLILHRVGARRWISRIMISWSIVAGAMAFMRTPAQFYALRFILGVAEAGFFPGVVYYLTAWVPATHRARLIGAFMTAIPLSTAIGGPLSSAILRLDGLLGMAGWRWLLLCQTLPSLLLGIVCLRYLHDRPANARWLRSEERDWLTRSLAAERAAAGGASPPSVVRTLASPRVLALSVCYFGADMCLYGVLLWLPQILSSTGVPAASSGYWVALPYGLAAIGMVWWSRHSDRTGERVWHLALAAAVAFVGVAASAALSDSPFWSLVAITCGAVGTLAALPIFWTLPTAAASGAAAAAAIALINTVGNLGGFAGPYVIGWVRSATGSFNLGLLAVGTGMLLTGVTAVLVGHDPAVGRRAPTRN
jgi:MFS transporter, ACS family, tartrate transporter